MNKIGLSSNTKEAPDNYPALPKHRRHDYPGPEDVQPAKGGRIDKSEMSDYREIESEMQLEPQGPEVRVQYRTLFMR